MVSPATASLGGVYRCNCVRRTVACTGVLSAKVKGFVMATRHTPSIVFVHRIWADGSCFSKLMLSLQAEGYEVFASQHRLDTFDDDIETARQTIDRASGPVFAGWPFVRRLAYHACWNGPSNGRPRLHRGPQSRLGRDLARASSQVPNCGHLLAHRGEIWACLDETRWNCLLRGRSA